MKTVSVPHRRELIIKTKDCDKNLLAEAILKEDGKPVVYLRDTGMPAVGSLYYGRIRDYLPGSEACFIDVGLPDGPVFCDNGNAHPVGTDVICQLSAFAHDNKAPRVTLDIRITGVFCVVLLSDCGCRVSKKISPPERERLQVLGETIRKNSDIPGLILRTESAEASPEALAEEAKRLFSFWRNLRQETYVRFGPIAPISQLVRLILDYPVTGYTEISVDSPTFAKKLCETLPELADRIHCVTSSDFDIFAVKSVDTVSASLLGRRVWLKSGGNIVIEKTEAMTVIDINSAKAVKGDLAFSINREAAEEIMRQLRLRNIGGLILCDFIDMKDSEKEREILRIMRGLAEPDPGNPQVEGFTKFGLVEICRRRT